MATAEEQPLKRSSTPVIFGTLRTANSVDELLAALGSPDVSEIDITRDVEGFPELRLSPGQTLRGSRKMQPLLAFAPGNDGLELTADNSLSHLRLRVEPSKCAIKNDGNFQRFGRVLLQDVETIGTTFGESAIGFVNFGQLGLLSMRAPIETHGTGARGFNSGTVLQAEFDRVETHGDGAIAIQINRPVGTIYVRRGIETHGGRGKSLVKGVIEELVATALSVRPGGSAQEVPINGGLRT